MTNIALQTALAPSSEPLLRPAEEAALAALVESGALAPEAQARAVQAIAAGGGTLVRVLTGLSLISEAELARALAGHLGADYADKEVLSGAPVALEGVSPRFLAAARLCPLAADEEEVRVALADPFDETPLRALALACGRRVVPVLAAAGDIEEALGRAGGSDLPAELGSQVAADLARLQDGASEAPVIRYVNALIRRALEARASDVHIEPMPDRLRVRFRIDGVLHDRDSPPLSMAPAILSRLKIVSGLNIAERRLPQDGGVKLAAGGREVDLRIATAPAAYGECAVVRILDRSDVALDLRALGYGGDALARIHDLIDRPNGVMLVTGPTGSGKSTTLYAALSRLNAPERKLITVEDPVEQKIPGVNQIQVKPDIGLSFAAVLRSILRHDPDVIMIGEIRDAETARIAVQASLTGHMVLATLHTNSAAAAVTRLLDMGVENYLLASTLSGVLAQRLVRVLCACAEPAPPGAALRAEAALLGLVPDGAKTRAPKGCAACAGTGYRGRTAVHELLVVGDALRAQILAGGDAGALHAAAAAGGMTPLYTDGLRLVLSGKTTQAELLRVARDSL